MFDKNIFETRGSAWIEVNNKRYPVRITETTCINNRGHLESITFSGYVLTQSNLDTMLIDRVIFNDPATIVKWKDGTKTVVKCQDGDVYDPEKGLAMCITKKALGNDRNYYDVFKKWLPKDEPMSFQEFVKAINNLFGIKPTEEPKEEPLYNGRVVCIDTNGYSAFYTLGKIYEFKNGCFKDDRGDLSPIREGVKTFEDWTRRSGAKWLEIKE